MGEFLRQLWMDWSVLWKQFIVMDIVLFILPIALSIWMYSDAKEHGDRGAVWWAVGGIVCWPIALILFLVARSNRPR